MQLLHSCYDLQNCFEKTELDMMWEVANGVPPDKKISKAVLTRWWHVNTAAQHLYDNWDAWKNFAQISLNTTTANTATGKITSSILSLTEKKKIECDLSFLVAYSKAFFVPNMEWLQQYDPFAKYSSYLLQLMRVITCIILGDLKRISETWETDLILSDFVKLAKKNSDDRKRPDLEVS